MEPTNLELVKKLHLELGERYRTHGAAVECLWRQLDRKQRTTVLKAGAVDGIVLKHYADRSLGNVYKLTPELNARDIGESEDYLLNILKFRANTSLCDQYYGVNGEPGDHAFIDNMIRTKGLRHPQPFTDCYSLFIDEKNYGESYNFPLDRLSAFTTAVQAGVCVPQATGELILQRQLTLCQALTLSIQDILDHAPRIKAQKQRAKASASATAHSSPTKVTLPGLISLAHNQVASFEETLGLFAVEPVVLVHAINRCVSSRHELVADEKGRRPPVQPDRDINASLFDVIQSAITGSVIWKYLGRLLHLLENVGSNKAYKALLLQELSNICHWEYSRTQGLFRRHVQVDTGSKWFKRIFNVYDNRQCRVTMKGNPDDLILSDPQLHCLLRLCQSDTDASKAVAWAEKLAHVQKLHPKERGKLTESEADTLYDLEVLIGFVHDLSTIMTLPCLSHKKGQIFLGKYKALDAKLHQLKPTVDLRELVFPIDNLFETGVADIALKLFNGIIAKEAGASMEILFLDLVEDCFLELQNQHQLQVEARSKQKAKAVSITPPVPTPSQPGVHANERDQHEQDGSSRPSALESASSTGSTCSGAPISSEDSFQVSSSTGEVFSALFDKAQASRLVEWEAFEAAMLELGFSAWPRFGCVYTFVPPDTMADLQPVTFHRPHKSRIGTHKIPAMAQRLTGAYGWCAQTFEVP